MEKMFSEKNINYSIVMEENPTMAASGFMEMVDPVFEMVYPMYTCVPNRCKWVW